MISCHLLLVILVLSGAISKGNEVAAEDQLEDPFVHLPPRKPRIVNGNKSIPNSRPFFAKAATDQLSYTPDVMCGATLIWPDIAITAAHCQGAFNNGLNVLDETTSDYTRLVPIDRQVRHPGWSISRQQLNYDVLVMRLTTPLSGNDAAKPIPVNKDSFYPGNKEQLKAYGFGITESQVVSTYLREADVTYINNDECWGRGINFNNVLKSEEVMCTDPYAGRTATCLGDSGGPLTDTTGSTLVGVISFGSGCEADLIPDGHVRLSQVADWVEEQICMLSANPPKECGSIIEARDPRAVEIVIDFTHDFFPEHTTFAVRSRTTQETLYAGPEYIPNRNGNHKESISLIPGEYIFEVYDIEGNGLASELGNGVWKVSALYDGCSETELASGGHYFTHEQATSFAISASMVSYNSNCGGDALTKIVAPPTNDDVSRVNDVLSEQLDQCLIEQKAELVIGAVFSTTCYCAPNTTSGNIELECTNEEGQLCALNHASCVNSIDCCSGRMCVNGQCQSADKNAPTKDRTKIGGTNIGGAAVRDGVSPGKLRRR